MTALLTIGEFSRATHVSVKALRHYDELGLLTPADVDRATGYRFYATAQVPSARVIRRFRELDMPLEQIREVLTAEDPGARDRVILEHLAHMETKLDETRNTVTSLRELLAGEGASIRVEHRTLDTTHALAISEMLGWDDGEAWLTDAFDELYEAVRASHLERTGPDGAMYMSEFFELHEGVVVAFVPVPENLEVTGRVHSVDLPGGDFAVAVHEGPFSTIDATYGALGTYVVERAIGADAPIREHYLDTSAVGGDPADPRTEVCWPIRRDQGAG